MAIRQVVSQERAESVGFANIKAVANYPGSNEPLYLETTHEGLVLELGENNHYDDSDFYAVVWNPEKGETEKVYYASTRFPTYHNSASRDATPEVLGAYEAWARRKDAERQAANAAKEAATPKVGKTVRVVKGRKVPKGVVGEVFWTGRDQFKGGLRIGIQTTTGERHFLAGSNVEVVTGSVDQAA